MAELTIHMESTTADVLCDSLWDTLQHYDNVLSDKTFTDPDGARVRKAAIVFAARDLLRTMPGAVRNAQKLRNYLNGEKAE